MNVLITGAGKGIGLALTNAFLKEGHAVFAVSRHIESLNKIVNPDLTAYSFDLTHGDYSPLFEKINHTFKYIDVLINNAGALINKPLLEFSDTDFDLLFDINVKAAFKMVQGCVPLMNPGSHIVNISSIGGFQGSVKFPGLSLYSASKGALAVLTESMAVELADNKIAVNALALGAVQTEMLSAAFPGYKAPLKPDEMAAFIKDFALSGHKVFNGKILPVSLSTP
jgi:NAD(P)-dependent dehydrogenase (short-subunit alcohol dehydrogenase family)